MFIKDVNTIMLGHCKVVGIDPEFLCVDYGKQSMFNGLILFENTISLKYTESAWTWAYARIGAPIGGTYLYPLSDDCPVHLEQLIEALEQDADCKAELQKFKETHAL